jgi:septal ring-binding cell division protein DamX
MTPIETELNTALKLKQKKGENHQLYLSRIITTIQSIPEDTWEALSVPAQRWANVATRAYEAKTDIPGFEEDEIAAAANGAKAPKAGAKAAPKAAAKTAAPAKPAATTAAKAAAKPAAKTAAKAVSMCHTIKQLVVKNPEMPVPDLAAKLTSMGFEKPNAVTIMTVRSDTRNTIKVLQDGGYLNKQMIA